MGFNPFAIFKKSPPTLVFVCSANITRSPYFEALFKKIIAEKPIPLLSDLAVTSAGVNARPGSPIHPVISIILKMDEIKFIGHRAKRFGARLAKKASLALVTEEWQKKKILDDFPKMDGKVFTVLEYGRNEGSLKSLDTIDIADPTGMEVDDFREFVEIANNEAERIRNVLAINGL